MLDEPVERRAFLRQFLQEHVVPLQAIIRAYVLRGGVAYGDAVDAVVQDVFQDAVLEALAHAERLDPATQPRAWFLSIALNIIRRRRASQVRRNRREVPISNLSGGAEHAGESELFEQVARDCAPGPEQDLETREQVQEMLALVSRSDAQVLNLAIVEGLDTESLASTLGVRPVAARVRLHRAIRRLRAAWHRREGGGDHA